MECYRALVTQCPSAVLLLAPRHIERVESVEAMIRARGFAVQRRSTIGQAGAPRCTGPRVVVLDSRGELAAIYREAVVVPSEAHLSQLVDTICWSRLSGRNRCCSVPTPTIVRRLQTF